MSTLGGAVVDMDGGKFIACHLSDSLKPCGTRLRLIDGSSRLAHGGHLCYHVIDKLLLWKRPQGLYCQLPSQPQHASDRLARALLFITHSSVLNFGPFLQVVECLAEGKPKQFGKARWADGMVAALCEMCAEPGGIDRPLAGGDDDEDDDEDVPGCRIASQVRPGSHRSSRQLLRYKKSSACQLRHQLPGCQGGRGGS